MAEHRAPRVGDRDDEYKARRRNLIISPERHDPFAGEILFVVVSDLFALRVSHYLLYSVSWIFRMLDLDSVLSCLLLCSLCLHKNAHKLCCCCHSLVVECLCQ